MAQIHCKANTTQFLINGMQPIQGKKLVTLDEIQHFYDHYDEILKETQTTITRQKDEIIRILNDNESRLDRQLNDTIARQTIEVDKNIDDLNRNISFEKGFLTRTSYRLQHWIAVALRDRHIHVPCAGISHELRTVRDQKNYQIEIKQSTIQKELEPIKSSYDFLKAHEPFLIGSKGEEAVITALLQLSDDYHVLNDVNLRFKPALFWNKTGEKIYTCQIDHIVVGPTGIFVLETKNWSSLNIEKKSDEVQYQVDRSGFALRSYIRDHYSWILDPPKIFYAIVSMSRKNMEWKMDNFIDVVSPDQLCDYIQRMKPTLSDDAVKKFIDIVSAQYK